MKLNITSQIDSLIKTMGPSVARCMKVDPKVVSDEMVIVFALQSLASQFERENSKIAAYIAAHGV